MSDTYEGKGNTPDLSGMLNTLLANPQALSMLTSLLGNMTQKKEKDESTPAAQETFAPALPPVRKDPRSGLLDALRPYLSPARCDMIDTLLRILELMTLLQKRR